MADETRLKRLTELVRLVWPNDLAEHLAPVEVDSGYYALVRGKWKQFVWIMHPRAADALEAVTLVLSSPRPSELLQKLRELAADLIDKEPEP